MKLRLRRLFGKSEQARLPDFFVSRDLHNSLEAIRPGAVEFISCRTGSEFAILHRDDFEHILELAKLKVDRRALSAKERG